MLPESNPKKSCRGSHHALRLHRNLLQSQAPPLSARLSLPTRVRKTLEQSNKPTKLNNCLSAFSKTDHLLGRARNQVHVGGFDHRQLCQFAALRRKRGNSLITVGISLRWLLCKKK